MAHDLHPEYLSTKLAGELDLPALAVQHHHAHVASCLVDHQRTGPVLGVAFDGLGFGPDGTLWGGEFLVADLDGFERVGHLLAVPLPGGTAAIREPWRMAVAWARQAAGRSGRPPSAPAWTPGPARCSTWRGRRVPPTTSVGRLFDAVAALLGGRTRVTYEGQAAIELEALASASPPARPSGTRRRSDREDGQLVLDPSPLIAALMELDPGSAGRRRLPRVLGQATAEAGPAWPADAGWPRWRSPGACSRTPA